ncbi:unnamed protein product [Lactuca saligna]|uniref:Uncharacterized protein n=1 Tax=Lactuca saligna TaxID=75948 RepID=A0AA35ZFH6_LACSI|nr:unnamed protein product [Lactuca saligna]
MEVGVLLKSQEDRLKAAMEQIESNPEESVKHHVETFQNEFKVLHEVAKERHVLFVEEVKQVQEYVNLKVESLNSKMSKEVTKFERVSCLYIQNWILSLRQFEI